jgi:hypothetical protein
MWKRRLIYAGCLVLLIIAGLVGWYFYTSFISNKELRNAIAEADRLDPGWRLEELEAKRAVIPPAENAAEQVLAIRAMMPQPWLPESLTKVPPPKPVRSNELPPVSLEQAIYDLPPEMQMSPEQTRELRAALEIIKESLVKARALGKYRGGRFQIAWSLPSTSTPHLDHCRAVTNLLWHDARLRAQDGDIDGALVSVLGILGVARSFGDEPSMISQIVRLAQSWVATQALERILAQGQASSNFLMSVQKAFEYEVSQPVFLFGVRGERAEHHRIMEAIKSGELKASSYYGSGFSVGPAGKVGAWLDDVSGEAMLRRSHGPWIRIMTKIVEIAKLPVEQQYPQLKSYLRSIDGKEAYEEAPMYVVPTMGRFGESFWRHQAFLRCAVVALAAERYRLAHGQWPESLNLLVPEFLAKVPLDPYDAKPLRYHRVADGVLIYSIGPDEEDNGGNLDRENPTKAGTDLGFRLWDVNRRRQPWRLPTKPKEEDDD